MTGGKKFKWKFNDYEKVFWRNCLYECNVDLIIYIKKIVVSVKGNTLKEKFKNVTVKIIKTIATFPFYSATKQNNVKYIKIEVEHTLTRYQFKIFSKLLYWFYYYF